ncbi:MAG TPA: TetR family transcriptional regulator [Burkholderiales bacterium]|nr:TetR family transcriptional regulator [Burkholderiales bacterium]
MRRTKEDSERTRRHILAAARKVFASQGVTRTSLEQIARAAGVTRGAIYWHFADKTALFYAMREQVSLPMVDRTGFAWFPADTADPLASVERFLLGVLRTLETDPATRETFQIMGFKCEYVDGLERELSLHNNRCTELYTKLAGVYRRAERARQLRKGLKPAPAALATCSFLVGLVRLWLMDRAGKQVRSKAKSIVKAHVDSLRRM